MIKKFLLAVISLLIITATYAQVRNKQTINSDWEFHKGDISGYPVSQEINVEWEQISLPHTWNNIDVSDEEPGYYRGIGWYRKNIYVPAAFKNKDIYLYFEGANQVADVYVNGQFVGRHSGGYTAFNFRINNYIHFNDSLAVAHIDIKIDNSHNENIPPLSADFSFYGGIYRDVYLLTAEPVHFKMDDHASPGIFIHTQVDSSKATINITGTICNLSPVKKRLKIVNGIYTEDGKLVGQSQQILAVGRNDSVSINESQTVKAPHLWSSDDPYLYHIVSRIYDAKTGNQLDELSNPLGLRWFKFSASEGFFLNGKHLKLIGSSRHQDYKGVGNALPDELHIRDMQLLKDMGANFIRIAHYPQDPALLQACDRLGLLASIEIPIVNRITETPEFTANCEHMQREMIRQNFNHPSIIIWAYMNEVMLAPRYNDHSNERTQYYAQVVALAKTLDSLTRKEDPSRYTMISCHGDFDRYFDTGLAKVPQIVGWNLYYGWYAKNLSGLDDFLEKHHQKLADKPLIITEFGADADSRLRSLNPQRMDKTVDYQLLYHQYYLKTIKKLPYVAGGAIWTLVDFSAEQRQEATPHVNTKGLLSNDREPKNAYFFYQANLLKTPDIKIDPNWNMRSGTADAQGQCLQPVTVFSNCPTVSLYINDQLVKTIETELGVAVFNVPFNNGKNQLKAKATINGKNIEDNAIIDFKMQPADLRSTQIPFTSINVSLGDERYFIDNTLHQLWVPEQPYMPGSWGYVGGEAFKIQGGLPYGSGKDILGTDDNPIYQTQRVGLSAFKLDVPDGQYEITLLFAELLTPNTDKALVYNLNSQVQKGTVSNRSFDVLINDNLVLKGLGTSNYLIPQHAYATKVITDVKDGQGITVKFNSIAGQSILNGIQVRKIY